MGDVEIILYFRNWVRKKYLQIFSVYIRLVEMALIMLQSLSKTAHNDFLLSVFVFLRVGMRLITTFIMWMGIKLRKEVSKGLKMLFNSKSELLTDIELEILCVCVRDKD